MQDHYIVGSPAIEIIHIRSEKYLLAEVDREWSHLPAQPVQEIYFRSCSKDNLEFSVPEIINCSRPAAERLREADSPHSLAVLIVKAEIQVLILIECVHLPGRRVLHLERAFRDKHHGVPLEYRSLAPYVLNPVYRK